MRKLALLLALCAVGLGASPARAQVSDAERAAARQLFKEGDELQREGKFPEALDKFQRAQQVFSAPTNMLRIAECQAALGRLVESAESYRAVVRTQLPAGSPPAFQAAVDQAKAELSQVEPRVPKLTVQVEPAGVQGAQLQIDGQNVPGALIGVPMELDPGTHKVMVFASGYASAEQSVILKEHEARSVPFTLKPVAGVTYAPGTAPGGTPPPLPPPPPVQTAAPPPGAIPPPPPRIEGPPQEAARPVSYKGFLFGGHLGWEQPAGNLPLSNDSNVDATNVSAGGLAYAIDGGFRFGRRWYVGLTLEHASLGQGHNIGVLPGGSNVGAVTSDTTLLGVVLAVMVNPDRASAYFEIGAANRWYGFTATMIDGSQPLSNGYSSGEFDIGLGVWIPAGSYVRLLPKVSLGLGSFSAPGVSSTSSTTSTSSNGAGHAFVMLGLGGFYNLDL